MIRFFGSNRTLVLFFLPLVVLLFNLVFHLTTDFQGEATLDMGWWGTWVISDGKTSIVYLIFSAFMVLVNAVLLNYTFNSGEFNERNTYLPSLNFIVFSAFSAEFYFFNGIQITVMMVLLALNQFLQLTQTKEGAASVFNGAFFIGIGISLYPPLLFSCPFMVLMYWVIRPFHWREFWYFIAGISTPLLHLWTYRFLFQLETPLYIFDWNLFITSFSISQAITTAMLIAALIVGIFGVLGKISGAGNRLKKEIRMLTWLTVFIVCGLIISLFIQNFEVHLLLLSIPISLYFTFSQISKRLQFAANLVFYLMFVFNLLKFSILHHHY